MNVCTCFLLFKIFALTNSFKIKLKENGRRFKPPLEPVIHYSNEYTKNLNNRHDFTATATDTAPKVKTFTDFILETVNILNNYEDTVFEDFFNILDIEIRMYHYTGCKFSELMQNHNTRRLLVNILKTIRENSIIFTKANINEMADILRDEIYDKNISELLDYINSLYKYNEPEFHVVLNNLKRYMKTQSMKTHKDFEQVIRDGVRNILFNHYTELDTHTRRELKEKIETFWENFKNPDRTEPPSYAEFNHSPNVDPVSKSGIDKNKISENINYKVNEHEIVFKNDPLTTFLDQRQKVVNKESYNEQSHDKEMEKDETSIEYGTLPADGFAEEISSGQSFASSSNSIKHSQERYKHYNTQRYMTLYTEEISYKARTTKKTEIIPISETAMTRRPTVPRRPTTTPRYSARDVTLDRKKKMKKLRINHDTSDSKQDIDFDSSHETEKGLTLKLKREPRARVHSDKQRYAVDAPKILRSQYDAIIAVQLANNELLKSFKMLAPVKMDTKSDTTLHQKSAGHNKLEATKNKIPATFMRVQEEIKPQKPNANSKSPSSHSKRKEFNPEKRKQPDECRRSKEPHLNNKELLVEKALNNNKQRHKSVRLTDTSKVKYFNEYVNSKIETLKNELTELKQINDVIRIIKNNTDEVDVRNLTDTDEIKKEYDNKRKHKKGNETELLNNNHDFNNKEVNDGHAYIIRSNTMTTVFTTNINTPPTAMVTKKDSATDIANDATSQTTDHNENNTKSDTEELHKAVSIDNVTTNVTAVETFIRNPLDHLDVMFLTRTL